MRDEASHAVATLARRLTEQLSGLRRRGSMNYSVNFSELAALLEVVEALAPEFEAAFRQGNVATLQAKGGRRVDGRVAVRALQAALEHEPEAWFLRLMLAYYLVADLSDEAGAAVQLGRAAAHPEAPFYVRSLAQRLQAPGADAPQGPVGELRLFRQMAQAQARVDAHLAQTGRRPASVAEALDDAEGRALLAQLEVDLVLTSEGQVVTRESQVREEMARSRSASFQKVKPYRLPEY